MSDPRIEIVTEAIDPGAFERCEPEKLAPLPTMTSVRPMGPAAFLR